MHSGELARFAGVSVRTLRHYHQVGVLPEPERRSNGYRDYGVRHLVRVLRIRRLAALGLPLERMPALLDDITGDPGALLAELDGELAAEIDRLSRQREVIARLRLAGGAPDVPPDLAPFLAALAARLPPDLAAMDRDQTVLVAHLVGEDHGPALARLYERISAPEALAEIAERFGRLGPDSTDDDVADVAERYVVALDGALDELADLSPSIDPRRASDVAQYSTELLNEQQRRVVALLERRLADRADGGVTS
ncbi:MerR family transcriptional regulator [Serinibacter arcticus]|uniref:MerR family transcriptional regulator n=1 Tax=Serinibacter arcticus TaxID=1655435 RepID=A0A2U1ZWZ7_9MICO|nr:MerR family transcriptional regulator [Serinibacter arcticus]PWD51501.1 MerR family transcriptional regulator [Serinibacter arcticus]